MYLCGETSAFAGRKSWRHTWRQLQWIRPDYEIRSSAQRQAAEIEHTGYHSTQPKQTGNAKVPLTVARHSNGRGRMLLAAPKPQNEYLGYHSSYAGTRDAVGWGTALQAGRSRVLWNYLLTILPSAVWRWGRLDSFMCRLSWNLGAPTSWNP
jgi:hypothetical protein